MVKKDRRKSLKDVKLDSPSCQAWSIFLLCTFTLFRAMNTWVHAELSGDCASMVSAKIGWRFSDRRDFRQKKYSYRGTKSVVHWGFDRQWAASSGAPATWKPSPRHGQPSHPTYQVTWWGQGTQPSQSFWNHLVLKEARRFEWDGSLSFLNLTV